MTRRRIAVLVVEDQFLMRMGLRAILDAEPDMAIVGEAETGADGMALFRKHRPDVTLMDLRLPGLSGLEAITAIRCECPDARIVVLTSSEGHEPIYRAFRAGAAAYLFKGVTKAQLLHAIRSVHAGKRVVPPEVAARLADRLPQSDLSPRECEVLTLIVRGCSNKEVAERLGVGVGTVRTHVSRILDKLGVRDRTQATAAALERGLVTA